MWHVLVKRRVLDKVLTANLRDRDHSEDLLEAREKDVDRRPALVNAVMNINVS